MVVDLELLFFAAKICIFFILGSKISKVKFELKYYLCHYIRLTLRQNISDFLEFMYLTLN